MKFAFTLALLASATLAHAQSSAPAASAAPSTSPAKKELIAKAIALQQPVFESLAREIVTRPAMQLGQAAGGALQNVPQDKREAVSKQVDADIRSYVDQSYPLLKERADKVAPTVLGPILEQNMSEDELRALVNWLDSPAAKKYQSLGGQMQQELVKALVNEATPLLTPKVQAMEAKVRTDLGLPAQNNSAPAAAGDPAPKPAAAPAKKSSTTK